MFDIEDQEQYDQITQKLRLTVAWAGLGFLAISGFKYWQIRTSNTNAMLGFTVILWSYMPAFIYHRYHTTKQTRFLRQISEKYSERMDDETLN